MNPKDEDTDNQGEETHHYALSKATTYPEPSAPPQMDSTFVGVSNQTTGRPGSPRSRRPRCWY